MLETALTDAMAMSFLMGAVSAPNLVVTLLETHGAKRPFGRPLSEVSSQLLSHEAIETRLDMVLAGLARPRSAK